MRWIKDHTYALIFIGGILVILSITVVCAWFKWTHTCIEWETGMPTGRHCMAWTTVQTSKHSSTTHCVSWKACRSCTRYVEDGSPDIPSELEVPEDRCP